MKKASFSCLHQWFALEMTSTGDGTRDDSQRRFSAQQSVATLLQHIVTLCCVKNRRCESSRVTSPQGKSAEIQYVRRCGTTNQKSLLDLGSVRSSVFNFCARCLDDFCGKFSCGVEKNICLVLC